MARARVTSNRPVIEIAEVLLRHGEDYAMPADSITSAPS